MAWKFAGLGVSPRKGRGRRPVKVPPANLEELRPYLLFAAMAEEEEDVISQRLWEKVEIRQALLEHSGYLKKKFRQKAKEISGKQFKEFWAAIKKSGVDRTLLQDLGQMLTRRLPAKAARVLIWSTADAVLESLVYGYWLQFLY